MTIFFNKLIILTNFELKTNIYPININILTNFELKTNILSFKNQIYDQFCINPCDFDQF